LLTKKPLKGSGHVLALFDLARLFEHDVTVTWNAFLKQPLLESLYGKIAADHAQSKNANVNVKRVANALRTKETAFQGILSGLMIAP
jgi:hypothetical protein